MFPCRRPAPRRVSSASARERLRDHRNPPPRINHPDAGPSRAGEIIVLGNDVGHAPSMELSQSQRDHSGDYDEKHEHNHKIPGHRAGQ